jgi:hypothetical protein
MQGNIHCICLAMVCVAYQMMMLSAAENTDGEKQSISKYSTFQCIGGSQVLKQESLFQTSVKVWPLNNPEFRTCHYQNVCLVNGALTFFSKISKGRPSA